MPDVEIQSSITQGSLARPMLRLAWPIVLMQLLQVAYNIADTFWLGRYSATAFAAVSLAFPLIFLLISFADGFTVAGSTLVAQYIGAESEGSAGKVTGQTLMFVGVLSLIFGAVGFLVTDDLLAFLPSQAETAQEVIPLAGDFMRVIFMGLPLMFGFFIFSALMRGYGNTKTPMRVMLISVLINVILDPILIFGLFVFPEMGIEGAALATILSRGVATVIGLYVLLGTDVGPNVEMSHFLPDVSYIRQILEVGVPSALESSTAALAMITLTAMVVTFSPPVIAGFGLGNRLVSLVFLPAMGLGRATNTMVGQNLGARKPERAEQAVWLAVKVGAGVMLTAAVVAAVFTEPIVGIFMATGTQEAAETIIHATNYLRIRSVEFVFIGILQIVLGAYRGAGSTKTALAFSLLTLWAGRVLTVYYLVFIVGMGPTGLWVGMAMGHIVGAVAATLWFTRGTWKRAVVYPDDTYSREGSVEREMTEAHTDD